VASRRQSTIWLEIEGNSIANKVKGRGEVERELQRTDVSADELSVTLQTKRKWPTCMVKRQVPMGE
jgi:hypothetical protein